MYVHTYIHTHTHTYRLYKGLMSHRRVFSRIWVGCVLMALENEGWRMQGSLAILAFRVCRRVRCFQKLPLLLDFVLDVRFHVGSS